MVLYPLAAVGQTSTPDAARRDEVRRQKATVAAGIDQLTASDEELEASVNTLSENLKAQQARAHDANRAADEARRHVEALNDSVNATQAEVDRLSEAVRLRAIEAYVNPNGALDTTEDALRSDDFTGAERKAELLNAATGADADAEEHLQAAKLELEQERNAAAAAQVEAQVREAEADAQVQQVQVAKEEADRMKAALDLRIANLHAELDALSAEEASIQAIIEKAQADAQAQAQARVAADATPSGGGETAAGPTSSSGSSSSGGSGGSGGSGSSGGGGESNSPAPAAPVPAPSGGALSWPAAGSVSSGYGPRWGRMHAGIDIAAPAGTPIVAANGGVVISASANSGGYGNLVLVDHGNGMVTAYAHQSRMAVSAGQSVGRGQLLGYVGCTGSCTGDHLHFEVRINGSAQNPMNYF